MWIKGIHPAQTERSARQRRQGPSIHYIPSVVFIVRCGGLIELFVLTKWVRATYRGSSSKGHDTCRCQVTIHLNKSVLATQEK
jgi:hypothetical protein